MTSRLVLRCAPFVGLALLAAGACTSDDDGPELNTETIEDPSVAHELDLGDVRLIVPPGAAPEPGTTVSGGRLGSEASEESPDFLSGAPPVVLESSATFEEPVTIELDVDLEDLPDTNGDLEVEPVAYVYLDELDAWAPQPSSYDPDSGVLRTETQRLSRWNWGLPLYGIGRLTGDRAAQLECAEEEPTWVRSATAVDDVNTSVFACLEADGLDARIRLRSNRGTPILLRPTSALELVGGDVLSRQISRAAFGERPGRLLLAPKQDLELRLVQPETMSHFALHRAGEPHERATLYLLQFLIDHVGEGQITIDLARCATRVMDLSAETGTDLAATSLSAMQDCIEPRLEMLRDAETITQHTFDHLSSAFVYFAVADHLATFLDASLVDAQDDVVFNVLSSGLLPVSADPADPGEPATVAQAPDRAAVILVVDVSGSMNRDDGSGRVRLDGAREAVMSFARGLSDDTNLGVRTYPGGSGTDEHGCSSGRPVIPPDAVDLERASALVAGLTADDNTPTSAALLAAAADLARTGTTQATIVLISDGVSNCGPPPCEVVGEIVEGGIDVTVHTVAFDIGSEGDAELRCIAEATSGLFASVNEADDLVEHTSGLASAQLELAVEHPDTVPAATAGPDGRVAVSATVTSSGAATARDVQLYLEVDADGAPGIVSPRRRVGNLATERSATQEWGFSLPPGVGERDLQLTVSARSPNAPPVAFDGVIAVTSDLNLDETGPLLRDRRRAVLLGDSYSSGEGAGSYLPGTFGSAEAWCHRSPDTYGQMLWDEQREILACSGAVSLDLFNASHQFPSEPAQIEQLADLVDDPPDVALMTIGGNDIGFNDIILRCLLRSECHDTTRQIEFECVGVRDCGMSTRTYESWVLDNIAGLRAQLRDAYVDVERVLNGPELRAARGGEPAPLVVLGYASPVPRNPIARTGCSLAFSGEELAFFGRVVDALNQTLEDTVDELAGAGLPIYFVSHVQHAFLPDHTYCDEVPFVRTLGSFSPALELDPQVIDRGMSRTLLVTPNPSPNLERLRELVHPTVDGYQAVTAALARWSVSNDAAQRPVSRRDTGVPSMPPQLGDPLDTLAFTEGTAGTLLQAGATYEIASAGHMPDSRIEARLASTPRLIGVATADTNGEVDLAMALPGDTAIGEHYLELSGIDADGTLRVQRLPVRVERGWSWPAYATLLAAGLAGVAGWRLRRAGQRQDLVAATN